jgi:hypothetical protein
MNNIPFHRTQVSLLFSFDSYDLFFKIWSISLNWSCLKTAALIQSIYIYMRLLNKWFAYYFYVLSYSLLKSEQSGKGQKKCWSKNYSLTWVDRKNFFPNSIPLILGVLQSRITALYGWMRSPGSELRVTCCNSFWQILRESSALFSSKS